MSGLALVPRILTVLEDIKETAYAGQVVNSQLSGPTGFSDLYPVALLLSELTLWSFSYKGTNPSHEGSTLMI